MSRPKRIQYPDAYYHVMNRGRGRCRIYSGHAYYKAFLDSLAQAIERFNLQVHAYCLMPNHYHLLVKTPDANLDRAMRHVNGVYTQRHNVLKKTDGALFRGRYKATVVDRESYYMTLIRYIHRNPIETRRPLAQSLEDYPWSSYPAYVGRAAAPDWLYAEEVIAAFNGDYSFASYRNYVGRENDADIVSFYTRKRTAPVLGDENFKRWVQRTFMAPQREHARYQTRLMRPTISEIIDQVAEFFSLYPNQVRQSEHRTTNIPRWIAMHLSQQRGGYALNQIAYEFGVNHYTSVSQLIRKLRVKMDHDAELADQVARLQKRFRS